MNKQISFTKNRNHSSRDENSTMNENGISIYTYRNEKAIREIISKLRRQGINAELCKR